MLGLTLQLLVLGHPERRDVLQFLWDIKARDYASEKDRMEVRRGAGYDVVGFLPHPTPSRSHLHADARRQRRRCPCRRLATSTQRRHAWGPCCVSLLVVFTMYRLPSPKGHRPPSAHSPGHRHQMSISSPTFSAPWSDASTARLLRRVAWRADSSHRARWHHFGLRRGSAIITKGS